MIAPETGLTLAISASDRITAKIVRPASRNASKVPTGPDKAMTCPDVSKRPMPTAPEKAIPVSSKRTVLLSVWCTITRDMVLFQSTVQAIILEYLVTEFA